jgi:hypothetical protein
VSEQKNSSIVPTEIHFGQNTSMDISWLSEDERKALMLDRAKGLIDIEKKANELHVDANILKRTLDDLADTTRTVTDAGNAVTVTHSQTTKIGRTEVIMGNTAEAQRGKMSKSQTGEKDWTPYYFFAGILAIVLIAALMNK